MTEVYARIAREEPRPPHLSAPSVAPELEAIALRALEKDPLRRYPSALEFAEELRRFRSGQPVRARPASPLSRLWRGGRKYRGVLVALGLTVAVGAGWGLSVHRQHLAARDQAQAEGLLEAARPPLEQARAALYTNSVGVGEMQAAVTVAEHTALRALELAPGLALAHYRLGEARELRGDYEGAQDCFARAAALQPRFGPARYRLGRVLLWRAYGANLEVGSDEREARRAEAEQMVEKGIREIEAAQESGFDNDLHREIASAMLAYLRGDKETVHRICREGVLRFGKKEGVEEFHWLMGLVLGTPTAQIKAFDEALSLRPKFPLALYSRATVRDLDGAIEDYDQAIAISPGFAEAYLSRGSAKWAKKDAPGAYADFDHLIRTGCLLAGAYNGRGRTVLELMNDPDRALPDLDEAIRLHPEGYVLPYIARARAHLLKKDYPRAVADATKAIGISGWSDPYFIRGLARLELADAAGAASDLEEALKRGPVDPAFRREVGAALERARRRP